jgi:NADH:ubiquinone oxidoreductase subunit C
MRLLRGISSTLRNSTRAKSTSPSAILQFVQSSIPTLVTKTTIYKDEQTIFTTTDNILNLLTFLKLNSKLRFTQLVDICAVDYPERENRFEVVYHLLSVDHNQRLRVTYN